jgi:geranylgeranyl diphosphate synthase type II
VFGEALAILVGDALLARAFEVLGGDVEPPAIAARCCAVLGRAAGASALVGGQVADLDVTCPVPAGDDAVSRLASVHRRKTGALFVAALELGGIVAGASDEHLAALISYGRKIGLAFQITDDLLDVSGAQATVGKRVAKDAKHGKRTYPAILGVDESRRRAKTLVDEACGMIEKFGSKGEPLRALAKFVCRRER